MSNVNIIVFYLLKLTCITASSLILLHVSFCLPSDSCLGNHPDYSAFIRSLAQIK